MGDQVPGPLRQVVIRILVLGLVQDLLPVLKVVPSLVDGGARERRIPGEGLVEHATEGPVVDREIVLFGAAEDFGRHVVWGANDGFRVVCVAFPKCSVGFSALECRPLRDIHVLHLVQTQLHALHSVRAQLTGTEAEVGEFNVARRVDEEVLGLQVAMDVAEVVESVDGGEHLRDVESGVVEMQDSRVVE